MALKALNNINGKLKFFDHKNKFLSPKLCRMLRNALIQPHFGNVCFLWCPNLNGKLKKKKKIQIAQSKCIRLCWKLDKRHHISNKKFKSVNCFLVYKMVRQCTNAITFEFFKNDFRKSNMEQKGLSYIGTLLWNKIPGSMKKATYLNTVKQTVKAISWQFSWKLGLIGLLLVFTDIPYPFIYLFSSLTYSTFCFNFCCTYLPFFWSFLKICFYIIYYVSVALLHYVSNLLLLMLQCHCLFSIYVCIYLLIPHYK